MLLLLVFIVLLATIEVMLHGALALTFPTLTIVPMLVLLSLAIVTMRSNLKFPHVLAITIGMGILFEVMYSHSQFIYVVAYVLAIGFVKVIAKIVSHSPMTAFFTSIVAIFLSQLVVFAYYYFQQPVEIVSFFTSHFAPTLVVNGLLFIGLYPLIELVLKTYKISCDNTML